MFPNEFVISLSFLGTLRALEGASAIFNFDGTYSTHTLTPDEAARAQKAAQICVAKSDSPLPEIKAAWADWLSTNRIAGVFGVTNYQTQSAKG